MCMPLVHIWTFTSLITQLHTNHVHASGTHLNVHIIDHSDAYYANNFLCAESVLSTYKHTQVVSQSKLFLCLLPLVQPYSHNNNWVRNQRKLLCLKLDTLLSWLCRGNGFCVVCAVMVTGRWVTSLCAVCYSVITSLCSVRRSVITSLCALCHSVDDWSPH